MARFCTLLVKNRHVQRSGQLLLRGRVGLIHSDFMRLPRSVCPPRSSMQGSLLRQIIMNSCIKRSSNERCRRYFRPKSFPPPIIFFSRDSFSSALILALPFCSFRAGCAPSAISVSPSASYCGCCTCNSRADCWC